MEKHPGHILLSPRITEKGAYLSEHGAYVFNVHASATKAQIAAAVRQLFKVTPRKVSVVDVPNENISPASFNLSQNYPNPFNPATKITYSIPNESQVNLKIYDVMGREVAVLVNGRQQAGTYEVNFNAASLASGTYFYKLTAGDFVSVKKMILLK